MKKTLLLSAILLALTSISFSQALTRSQLRDGFLRAVKSRAALDSFTLALDLRTGRTAQEECYLGMCDAMQISYISGMWSKLKMLDRSRTHVGKAITAAPQDAELHFLRFMLEHNIPSFLGMSGHIREDIAFVLDHSTFLDEDTEMKKMVIEYMISSKRCTSSQTAMLQKSLDDLKRKQYAQR
ncbi:MAG: hypothetical protein JSS76_03085 [Bacteroidetes bacterium]|nr:hypothetical protein [Bacteroidota bacterium]